MLLVSLAHHFLARLRIQFQEQALALTMYQVRICFVVFCLHLFLIFNLL